MTLIDIIDDEATMDNDHSELIECLNLDNLGSEVPEYSNQMNNIDNDQQNTDNMLLEDARRSTNTAVERMIPRSMWRNDYIEFELGCRVLIRPDTDANERTRVRPLYEHLDTTVYIVEEILQFNRVKLVCESDSSIIIEEIDIIRLRRLGDNH